jgi:hypothetical protein
VDDPEAGGEPRPATASAAPPVEPTTRSDIAGVFATAARDALALWWRTSFPGRNSPLYREQTA